MARPRESSQSAHDSKVCLPWGLSMHSFKQILLKTKSFDFTTLFRSLKSAGTHGLHTVILATHINMLALHIQMGFEDVTDKDAPEDMLVLAMKL